MGGEDDGSSSGDGFPLFQWEMNGSDDEWTGSTEENESTDHVKTIDLAEELSRLAIIDGDGCECNGNDLPSVIGRVALPLPCHHLCDHETKIGTQGEFQPDRDNVEARNSGCIIYNIICIRQKNNAVQHYMGSMAQCRGPAGDTLREAGAIRALLGILWELIVPLPMQNYVNTQNDCPQIAIALLPTIASESDHNISLTNNGTEIKFDLQSLCEKHQYLQNSDPSFEQMVTAEFDTAALDLAMSCLGSIRDLSCGSALNRAAVLSWTPPSSLQFGAQNIENGVHVLSAYVKRYDQLSWEDILSLKKCGSNNIMNSTVSASDSTTYTERGRKELRLLTNALGAVRNTSHSTPDVCQEFFDYGLVDILVRRLMPEMSSENSQSTNINIAASSSFPDVSRPWREACFRVASSLINIAEKCPDVAYQLGSNHSLIYLLIEAWGGAGAITVDSDKKSHKQKSLLLHLGLAAILNAADSGGALEGGLDDVMTQILEREKIRKRNAQQREEERKRQQAKKK